MAQLLRVEKNSMVVSSKDEEGHVMGNHFYDFFLEVSCANLKIIEQLSLIIMKFKQKNMSFIVKRYHHSSVSGGNFDNAAFVLNKLRKGCK